MSTGLLACVALLGALTGLAAPRVAHHFTAPFPPRVAGIAPDVLRAAGSTPRAAEAAPLPPRVAGAVPSAGWGAAAGAVAFAGLAAALGADPVLPVLLVLAAVGLVLALVDLACLRLPDPLVGAAALVAAVGLTGAAATAGSPGRLLGAAAGAVLCFACHVVLAVLPGSRLGFGDVKLAAVLACRSAGSAGRPWRSDCSCRTCCTACWCSSCWWPAGCVAIPRSRWARPCSPAPGWPP